MIVVKKKEIAEPKLVLSLLNWFGFVEGRGILRGTATLPTLSFRAYRTIVGSKNLQKVRILPFIYFDSK